MSVVEQPTPVATADTAATRAELVARAVALRPLLREHAAAAEDNRRLSDEVNDVLTRAGMFRMLIRKQYGGYQADLRTVLEVTEALAEADSSASWVVSVGSVSSWIACVCSEQAQQDIFGADSDARFAGGVGPTVATPVEGGLRLSGRWGYASGSPHATWASLGAALTDDAGQVVDAVLSFVPVSEVTLEETWLTVGMRGTGSHTFVVDDVFVPRHRTISMSALSEGVCAVPADDPLYHVPFGALATLLLLGPLLGLGHAALDWTVAKAPTKPIHHTFFPRQTDSVGVQIDIARAALTLETARLHIYGAADELDSTVTRGEQIDFAARARLRAKFGYAAQQVLEAIHILLNVHGAGSFAEASPMQRYWRDANTAARHAGLNSTVGYETFGKSLLGVEERIGGIA